MNCNQRLHELTLRVIVDEIKIKGAKIRSFFVLSLTSLPILECPQNVIIIYFSFVGGLVFVGDVIVMDCGVCEISII